MSVPVIFQSAQVSFAMVIFSYSQDKAYIHGEFSSQAIYNNYYYEVI